MQKRERRSNYWLKEPVKPRVREFRAMLGYSAQRVAELIRERTGVKFAPSQIVRIEIGEIALTLDKARLLAAALDVTPSDLFADMPLTVPLKWRVAWDEAAPGMAPPYERIGAPNFLARPHECFAARIDDDSADRMPYPLGTILFVRPPLYCGGTVGLGERLVVAQFAGARGDGHVIHAVAGEFTASALGDMLVRLRTSSRAAPPAIVIRDGAAAPAGFAETDIPYRPDRLSYQPRPNDPAEILGRIDAAQMPVSDSDVPRISG